MGTRISLEIGKRDFKFGDPYFRCPQCGKQGFFNGQHGDCYSCRVPYIVTEVKPQEDPKPNHDTIVTCLVLGLLASIVYESIRPK